MDMRTSRVEASATVPGVGGKNIGPGQLVDLDEVVGGGQTVRDLFPAEWFEPVPAAPAAGNVTPARRAKE